MTKLIHVLVLEDNIDDAEIQIRALRKAGFDPQWKRVETEADYLAGLDALPGLILADYNLPNFNGVRAAQLLHERGLDIPFILISGAVGEEVAAEAIKQGATDYVLKDRLARLGAAVERALEETRLRAERKQAEDALKKRAAELEQFHRLSVGREFQMIELKREVNEAAQKAGGTPPYDLSLQDESTERGRSGIFAGLGSGTKLIRPDKTTILHDPGHIWLRRALNAAVLVTALAVGWMSWALFQVYEHASVKIPQALQMQKLMSDVLWLDDLKSMAARKAASTGEPYWEGRYTKIKTDLEFTLTESLQLQREYPGAPDAKKYLAADKLMDESERNAFDLIHRGRLSEAQALLDTVKYKTEEKTYSDGLEKVSGWLMDAASASVTHLQQKAHGSNVVAISVMSILLVCWSFIIVLMRRWQSTLVQINRQLNAQAVLLEDYSHQLDRVVDERTRQLRESKIALTNMMSDTVRSRENVQRALDDLQREVMERKKIEAQFVQSQKMEAFGLLAGGVAHDFNNLMSVVMGYSDIWLMKLPPDAPIRGPLKAIRNAGERASDLTKQLLAFSRKTVLEPKVVDLNAITRETEKMLKRLIGEDIQLTTILNPSIPRIKLDPGQLGQVLMNLAVNARDAMPRGGSLTMETRTVDFDDAYVQSHLGTNPGRHVMLSVSDTGTGMPPEILTRIFEPFFTTKGAGKGTGLGLAVVHGVVTQSAGSIQVESKVGAGTTFMLYFPATPEEVHPANKSGEIVIHAGIETILVVEDEESLCEIAKQSLQSFGYTVLMARSGSEALKLVNAHEGTIDLLLTDVVMPGMSGRELAGTLKPKLPETKVVFMSGYTDDSVVRHGIDHENVAFLQKPFAPFDLLKKVREELDKR